MRWFEAKTDILQPSFHPPLPFPFRRQKSRLHVPRRASESSLGEKHVATMKEITRRETRSIVEVVSERARVCIKVRTGDQGPGARHVLHARTHARHPKKKKRLLVYLSGLHE